MCTCLCVLQPHPEGGSKMKVTHCPSLAYKYKWRLLSSGAVAQQFCKFLLHKRAALLKVTTCLQHRSFTKRESHYLLFTIQFNMATRWGLCGAGKISHDFSVAMKTLPAEDHQVTDTSQLTPVSIFNQTVCLI